MEKKDFVNELAFELSVLSNMASRLLEVDRVREAVEVHMRSEGILLALRMVTTDEWPPAWCAKALKSIRVTIANRVAYIQQKETEGANGTDKHKGKLATLVHLCDIILAKTAQYSNFKA